MCGINIFDYISEINPEALSIGGYDHCIIGLCHSYNGTVIAYDRQGIINTLRDRDGMAIENAEKFFEDYIHTNYAGDNMPVFITRLDES
jgi:hypothetical protein